MVNFGQAIKRPFSDKKTLLISFAIGLIPVINFLLVGFAAHHAKNFFGGKKELPHWNSSSMVGYIIKAILLGVITLVYTLLGWIVLAVSLGTALLGTLAHPFETVALTNTIISAGLIALVGLLLLLIGVLMTPIAIMSYLKSGRFIDAFAIGKILKRILTVKYLVSIIVLAAYFDVLLIVFGIITAITIGIGLLLGGGFFLYIFAVTAFEVFARTYDETQ